MMVQSPLKALVDPQRDLPIMTQGDHVRRRSHRFPCSAAARLRIGECIHEVQFMDVSYGGGCVLAADDVRPEPGDEGQVVATTKSGLCGDNIVVVQTEPRDNGTVIRFKLSQGRATDRF